MYKHVRGTVHVEISAELALEFNCVLQHLACSNIYMF